MCTIHSFLWIIYFSGYVLIETVSEHINKNNSDVTQQEVNDTEIDGHREIVVQVNKTHSANSSYTTSYEGINVNQPHIECDPSDFITNHTETILNITNTFNDSSLVFLEANETTAGDPISNYLKSSDSRLTETAGFVAIGFVIFAAIGYGGFVLWRRYLQNKYGNSQTLITEDVYDISDLRHFEI